MSGLFVTGTGTEVGKTVVAAALARTALGRGETVAVFKPAVSGLDDPGEPDHELLRRAAGSRQSDDEIAPYRYGPPVSPHLAADIEGEEIDRRRLLDGFEAAASRATMTIVEGVGGFLVPLRRDYLIRDFAGDLALPVVVVASPGLGTINHTLLTVEAVRGAGLEVAGVVLTPWPGEAEASGPSEIERSNRETIQLLSGAEVAVLARLELSEPGAWPSLELGGAPRRRAGAPN